MSELECPDCGGAEVYEDESHRLYCHDCGNINDSFAMRYETGEDADAHDSGGASGDD
jgi:transcription initiation factor TFIIIB Brf1 subunit/transcription initiation factor TFIIB